MASVNKAVLERMYVSEMLSIPDLGKVFGLGYSASRKLLLDFGISIRSRADGVRAASHKLGKHMVGKKRVFSDAWKENIRTSRARTSDLTAKGVSHKTNGYSEFTRGENKGRGVHVVVMEGIIGRRLLCGEVVHHADENKQNNAVNNLELMSRSKHTQLHRQSKKEIKNG